MSKTKSIIVLTVLAILIAFFGFASFVSGPVPGSVKDYTSIFGAISKGIDLEGGYYAVLKPKSDDKSVSGEALESVMETLRKRLSDNGYTEATVEKQNSTWIRIEIPDVDDYEKVFEIIGGQGKLSFKDSSGTEKLNGSDISNAYQGYDEDGNPCVVLEFTAQGRKRFAQATGEISSSSNKTMSIYLGDTLISSPTCEEKIDNNSAIIKLGNKSSVSEAKTIASVIKSGSLEVELEVNESGELSATLGKDALKNAMISAGIGLAIIFIIIIAVYGGMGLAASIALLIYVLLYVGVLAVFPFVQLTFPGIAGIILSIGMAVDANVIIFDRIKEEYAMGKTRKAAIAAGYKRAVITVIDSNVTTILAAVVLWILTTGSLKGFAITLFLGVLVSMFTAVVVTRWLTNVVSGLVIEEKKDRFLALKRRAE